MKTQAREIRFIAKSAHEAADHVRRELGPEAQVISVRQVTGSGLQRFLKAPQLEIVAREFEVQPEVATPHSEPQGIKEPASVEIPVIARSTKPSLSCGDLLARAGFSLALMARLEGAEAWREIQSLSVEQGLPRAISWLHNYRSSLVKTERPSRIAFLGGPGSGKTTSLCKYLAREVFIHGKKPEVLRLEVDKPHLDNGLSLYCDILGVRCLEDPSEVGFSSEQPVLVDVPGFLLHADNEKERIREALDAIEVTGRVLVLNAAYEASVMQRFTQDGADIGANFQVLTHLDEL
ncbi:MAG: hypothetical protein O7C75_18170, partial [Verrucomicrobia bacterium]|nr:hypothetical protein [Verrucomicrobiota bacterium]